ncbi:Sas10 C-terminal domain-containing protein [Lactarius hengduanensis]|nr:Sas10 C-terminal domain-containing protein [Lactarius hengduanensis]
MVRRRSSKSKDIRRGPRPLDKKDARIKRWNTSADIPMDEEDLFHASKDRILLEGEGVGADEDEGEEDVFALKGIQSSDSDEDAEDIYEKEGQDDEENQPRPEVRTSRKGKGKARPPPESEDEEEEEEEEEEESWGHKKSAYYSSNAAELDSEDEEANELEEQEARRLQVKARDAMADDDFGLADIAREDAEEAEDPLLEPASVVTTRPIPLDKNGALRHIEKTNPETLALAYDWDDIAAKVVRAQEKIKELSSTEPNSQVLGMAHLHNQALLTYATTLAFYLYLRASEHYSHHPDLLRSHPIFSRLLQLKQALVSLEGLDSHLSESDSGIGDSEDENDSLEDEELEDASILFKQYSNGSQLAFFDLAELLQETEEAEASANAMNKSKTVAPPLPTKEPPKKKRKTSTPNKPAPVFDLEEPTYVPPKPRAPARTSVYAGEDVFGDAVVLGAADAADKKARGHTLRFHTSKIESASARRKGARTALGGDDDVPYRERRKEKEARAQREARAGGRGQGGDDLDNAQPESLARVAHEADMNGGDEESAEEDADGYYSLVQKRKREQKESRKTAYEAAKAESRVELDDDSAEGPRSLTRAILKNRGLTPRRSKSVRNPRVKKRQKFAKAKKVLASQKPVFKPGAGDSTWYGGERSGISTAVKSVRF